MSEVETLREEMRHLEEDVCDAEAQEYGAGRAAAEIARTLVEIQEEVDSLRGQRALCAAGDTVDLGRWRRLQAELSWQEDAAEDKQIEHDAYLQVAEEARCKVVELRKQHEDLKGKLAEYGRVLVFSLVKSDGIPSS